VLFLGGATISWSIASSLTTPWRGPATAGTIEAPSIDEASGLAPSHRLPGALWTHNDSGSQPVIYALNARGQLLGSVRIADATQIDWEDIASFEFEGRSYLLIADVGDNNAQRTDCVLYIVPEPDPATLDPRRESTVEVAWQIPVRYPQGPRDCESVAVDPRLQTVLLLSKRTKPSVAYELPLRPAPTVARPLAQVIGPLKGIPDPHGPLAMINAPWGRYRAQPCGFDISADGRAAVVLTYGEVYLYPRGDQQTWAEAFAADPIALDAHGLPQAEAVCFSLDGRTVFVTTEGRPAPLLVYQAQGKP